MRAPLPTWAYPGPVMTVVAETDDGVCTLSAADLAELDRAIAEADRHEPVAFEEVLADLDRVHATQRAR